MTVTINGTTGIAGTNGSAGTPAVQGEDTNTGIFFPAADTVAVATAGTERVRVDSSGNVAIGTSSPTGALHVSRSGLEAGITLERTTSATAKYTIAANDGNLTFTNSATGSERARIDASGNLGVGRTSPAPSTGASVDASGPHIARGFINDHQTSAAVFELNGNNASIRAYGATASSGFLTFKTGGGGGSADTERARIDASGNLLVGTTSGVNGHTFKSSEGVATYRPTGTAGNGIHHFYSDFGSTQSLRAYFTANGGLSNFSANNVNLSDERVKTDILPVGSYWDKVKALQVVTYKYRDQSDGEDNIGVIAQQVESVAPEFVCTSGFGETPEDGIPLKSIYETDMHYATLKALQEAMARIEELTARIAILEAK